MKALPLRLDDDLHRRAKVAAASEGVSLNAVLTDLLTRYVEQAEEEQSEPRKRSEPPGAKGEELTLSEANSTERSIAEAWGEELTLADPPEPPASPPQQPEELPPEPAPKKAPPGYEFQSDLMRRKYGQG